MPRLLHRLFLTTLLMLCVHGVSSHAQVQRAALPELGDGGELTASAERRLGERIAREIYQDPDYVDDAILSEYVEGIWQRLLAAARARGELTQELQERFAWEVLLGRDRSVNAFALPGGYMGVHLGLIGIVSTRDELASVLAHELSHVTQRHISRMTARQNQQTPWVIAAMILGGLAASKSPDAANAIIAGGQAAAVQGQLNFSRDMEREADRVGFAVLEQAGFDPSGFASMFDKLQKASRLNDYGAYPYLRSHPLTTERLADMASRDFGSARAVQVDGGDIEHQMVAARARALARSGVETLRSLVAEADTPRFDSQPQVRRSAVLYQSALASLRLNDVDRAERLLARLRPVVEGHAPGERMFVLLAAEIALQKALDGKLSADALTSSVHQVRALQGATRGDRRPELFAQAQLLLHAGRASEVSPMLAAWLTDHPRDAAAWQLLSASSRIQGNLLRSVRAEAEARAVRYDYTGALDRFKAAQEMLRTAGSGMAGGDHVDASIIDARARQVASLAREQALQR